MAKTKLNPATDTPTNLIQITTAFMKGYVSLKGDEDKKWFAAVVKNNIIEKATPNGGKVRTYNVKLVRREFAKKYFPHLIKSSKASSELDEILSWL